MTAIQTSGQAAAIDGAALRELERAFRGDLIRDGDPAYDERRAIWNGSIDRRPALIARCTSVEDVQAAIRFGRQSGLRVAIRSGGHSFPGHSVADGALVIDLRPMNAITVEPEKRTVRAQAGVLLGELDAETQKSGLAVPAGIVTTTGLTGLTLGGGIGWLMRKYGLTVDNLLSVELVTAQGKVVRASELENPELFWGMRGAGANFGVVTQFEFRAHPVGPTILAGPMFWRMEDSPKVMRFYRDWIADAPDELMTIVVHRMAPALPIVPPELVGKPVVVVTACWSGDIEEGQKVIRPMREFGSPVLDACAPKPFTAHQAMFDPSFPPGWWYYMRACDVDALSDEIIDITVEHSLRIRSPRTAFPIWQMGGAVSRTSEDATPFNGRKAGHTFNITGMTTTGDGFEGEREWVRDLWTALAPWHTSVYINFLQDEGEERIRAAYGPARYDRLKALKREYDPDNFFRLNQNISPD